MIYAYRCVSCGFKTDRTTRPAAPCPSCGSLMKRDYSFTQFSPPVFQPHFNYSIGRYVSSQKDFDDQLKSHSDSYSERLGLTANFQSIHPADLSTPEAFGATDEGLI